MRRKSALRTQSGVEETDVIVIGAGILGLFHAYFAARRGYRTLLLERDSFPDGASARNFGMILQSIVPPEGEWATYAQASRQIYLAIQREWPLALRPCGSLYVATTELEQQVLMEYAAIAAKSGGAEAHYLEQEEVRLRYPFLQRERVRAALLFPLDLAAEPRLLLRQLLAYVEKQGPVTYYPRRPVVALEPSRQGCLVYVATGERFYARHVFVCSGAEYRLLLPEQLARSGLRLCKLQMLQTVIQPGVLLPHLLLSGLSLRRYAGFLSCPTRPLLMQEPLEPDLQHYGIHLLCRQTEEGSVVLGDSHEYLLLEGADQEGPRPEESRWSINEAILRCARSMLSLPRWEIERLWNGYYLQHPEREIYVETLDGAIHIVTGIGGKGMSTGPGFAQAHIAATLP
ncbi:oxidase [Thermogemmatispora aurantia]|uniref:TIGR03364 family FAD-dependent oxidoreductase n=1 Tax=Thermogemmatispora aurantia TaxID=2045279 RepID=UPI00124EF710|nr:TIGR03364 family FAD-dependent oxidoreductase [Thermogemmatispora aurantia]GER84455.1 oxidase [Thermogemmatispora aurantia]